MKCAIIVGHSKVDGGAISVGGVSEFEYNDDLAKMIASNVDKRLETQIVYRTMAYSKLPIHVNHTGVDFAIELHFNSASPEASGAECLYWATSDKSHFLAMTLQTYIVDALGNKDRGLKEIDSVTDRGGNLLRNTSMPCVIVEPFFGSNAKDWRLAVDRKSKLAEGIAQALEEYGESLFRSQNRKSNTTLDLKKRQFDNGEKKA
jgi:N-acetylmuramoyl-L-alanine amidase